MKETNQSVSLQSHRPPTLYAQKVENSLTTDRERQLLRAVTGYTISDYAKHNVQDGKLNLQGSDLARYYVGQALLLVFKLVGLKIDNYPDNDQRLMLADIIEKGFGYLTPEEVYRAFELAILNVFEVSRDKGMSHYQNVDAIYVSDVLSAYARWAHPQKDQLIQAINEERKKETYLERLKEARRLNSNACISMISQAVTAIEDTGQLEQINMIRPEYYDFLVDLDIIKHDPAIFNEMFVLVSKVLGKSYHGDITNRTKQELVVKHIQEMLKEGRDRDVFWKYQANGKLTVSYLSHPVI